MKLHGHLADAQDGGYLITLALDNANVSVEYEFDDDNATKLLCVLVNGSWVDADKFSRSQCEEWIEAIDSEVSRENVRRREDAQADAYADRIAA